MEPVLILSPLRTLFNKNSKIGWDNLSARTNAMLQIIACLNFFDKFIISMHLLDLTYMTAENLSDSTFCWKKSNFKVICDDLPWNSHCWIRSHPGGLDWYPWCKCVLCCWAWWTKLFHFEKIYSLLSISHTRDSCLMCLPGLMALFLWHDLYF